MLVLGACRPGERSPVLPTPVPGAAALATLTALPPVPTNPPLPSRLAPLTPSPVPTRNVPTVSADKTTLVPADDDRIRFVGRFDGQDPLHPAFDWSGVTIEFAFTGTGLTLLLKDGRNLYNVDIDNDQHVLQTEMGRTTYVLADQLEPGSHMVRITKRTEAYVGAGVFSGLVVSGGDLLDPPPPKERLLEFIGDSITSGYGNEGDSPECWFTPGTQNAELSFAGQTAAGFNADYHLIALSGLGVVRNLRDENAFSSQTAIDFIDRALGLNPLIPWPASQSPPTAVIINLGTNDFSSTPFPDEATFVQAYVDLLQAVYLRHPGKPIFAMAGPLMLEPAPRLIEAAVVQFAAAQNDADITYVNIEDTLERSAADFGCDWHPNVDGHRKIAEQLMPHIAEVLGW